MNDANVVNAWAVSLLEGGGTQIGVPGGTKKSRLSIRGVRGREGGGRWEQERSYRAAAPARAPWELESLHQQWSVVVRWLDGLNGRSGRCRPERWHDDARFPRASTRSPARAALWATPGARFAFHQTRLRCIQGPYVRSD